MAEIKDGYFQKYTNLHRLASESLLSAIEHGNEAQLDEAETYAKEALTFAANLFETVLSQSFLNTVNMERLAFQAAKRYGVKYEH